MLKHWMTEVTFNVTDKTVFRCNAPDKEAAKQLLEEWIQDQRQKRSFNSAGYDFPKEVNLLPLADPFVVELVEDRLPSARPARPPTVPENAVDGCIRTFKGELKICADCWQPCYDEGPNGHYMHFLEQHDGVFCPNFPLANPIPGLKRLDEGQENFIKATYPNDTNPDHHGTVHS